MLSEGEGALFWFWKLRNGICGIVREFLAVEFLNNGLLFCGTDKFVMTGGEEIVVVTV